MLHRKKPLILDPVVKTEIWNFVNSFVTHLLIHLVKSARIILILTSQIKSLPTEEAVSALYKRVSLKNYIFNEKNYSILSFKSVNFVCITRQ